MIPIAAAMLRDVDEYFCHLDEYRDGNVDSIVVYVAESAIEAANASFVTANQFAELPQQWLEQTHARENSAVHTLASKLL